MAKFRTRPYTKDELNDASKTVMRSMNIINKKALKSPSFKPSITNSLGTQSKISKSSQRRHNRKARANLAGETMEKLVETLPLEELAKEPPVSMPKPVINPHKNRKSNQRVVQSEIKTYSKNVGASLGDIRARLREKMADSTD